jgi:hypothetical protein
MRIVNVYISHNYRLPDLRSLGMELLKPLKKVAAARKLGSCHRRKKEMKTVSS